MELDHAIESRAAQSLADLGNFCCRLRTGAMPEQAQPIVWTEPAISRRHSVRHRNAGKRRNDESGESARAGSFEDRPVFRLSLRHEDKARLFLTKGESIEIEQALDRIVIDGRLEPLLELCSVCQSRQRSESWCNRGALTLRIQRMSKLYVRLEHVHRPFDRLHLP